MEYRPTIGLEVHAELKTQTKLFCNSKNDPDEARPNVNVCPVCVGYPGTLPVLNREAVRHLLRVGLAVGGELADYTEFDRKNYFYPDIPKGYQISQYKYPLVSGGTLRGVALERVHLEEDTARSSHDKGDYSLIDFNRAGVPLMELVTRPVIKSGAEAAAFAKELQLLLRTLGAGDANLEKGEMRVEANISVSAGETLGTKVEIKNLNSFRAVERAIAYEIRRQSKVLETGGRVVQETRGWDEGKQETFSQRLKEESHDYRYFPDPDVPKLRRSELPEFSDARLRAELPELPWEKRARFTALGVKEEDVEIFVADTAMGEIFEVAAAELKDPAPIRTAANYLTSDIAGLLNTASDRSEALARLTGSSIAELVRMLSDGRLSSRGAKDILAHMVQKGGTPQELVAELGLAQESDKGKLGEVIAQILKEHETVVADYRSGKTSALQYLVGQGMKATKGSANPQVLREIIVEQLG